MFTMDNTQGFTEDDLDRMNDIVASIVFDLEFEDEVDECMTVGRIEEAVGQTFDPELSDAENEHWARERLGL